MCDRKWSPGVGDLYPYIARLRIQVCILATVVYLSRTTCIYDKKLCICAFFQYFDHVLRENFPSGDFPDTLRLDIIRLIVGDGSLSGWDPNLCNGIHHFQFSNIARRIDFPVQLASALIVKFNLLILADGRIIISLGENTFFEFTFSSSKKRCLNYFQKQGGGQLIPLGWPFIQQNQEYRFHIVLRTDLRCDIEIRGQDAAHCCTHTWIRRTISDVFLNFHNLIRVQSYDNIIATSTYLTYWIE